MSADPKIFYNNPKKRDYRRRAHAFIDRRLSVSGEYFVPVAERKILILDTAAALETMQLIAKGYRPSNIHVVNEMKGQIAWVTRRPGCRDVNTYGRTLLDALYEMHVNGVGSFNVIHLDLTCYTDQRTILEISAASRCLAPGGVIIVNTLRGREPRELLAPARQQTSLYGLKQVAAWWLDERSKYVCGESTSVEDLERLKRITFAMCGDIEGFRGKFNAFAVGCLGHIAAHSHGRYQADRSPMIWSANQLVPCNAQSQLIWTDLLDRIAVKRGLTISEVANACLTLPLCVNLALKRFHRDRRNWLNDRSVPS